MDASVHLLPLQPGCHAGCPACPHRHFRLQDSLEAKAGFLKARLSPYAEVLAAVHTAGEAFRRGYRDKVCLAAVYESGMWHIGTRSRGKVISIPGCPVHTGRVRNIHAYLLDQLPPAEDFPLAYVVQTAAQLCLVLKSRLLPADETLAFLRTLMTEAFAPEGIWIHLHPAAGKKVFGKGGWHLISGKAVSVDESGLVYGPAAFQQLLPALYYHALQSAREFLSPGDDSLLVDLYSGTGSSIRYWELPPGRVIGVEADGEAVRLAGINVPAVTLLRGACRQRLPQLNVWLAERNAAGRKRLLYVNPPRTGLEAEIIRWIMSDYRPSRLAYLSCSAGTLRRDLDLLADASYRVDSLIPYDFFPGTRHVETLACLSDTRQ
ncbi:MAG TPA: hypothetical protein P5531_12895 [Bacteroidales bacterium]|nr:hypothetical protein [Bacteroidales bacterium]HSA44409.1 hypothetical protein [Bacteroidales bacterium]